MPVRYDQDAKDHHRKEDHGWLPHGSTVQDELVGCWKLAWQLPIAFACPDHGIPLQDSCPQDHPAVPDLGPLISQVSDSSLHPAQCRQPRRGPAFRGRKRRPCGQRLDQRHVPGPEPARLPPEALALQRRMFAMLEPGHPAEGAAAYFTDLRVVTAMLCITWPDSSNLAEPAAQAPLAGQDSGATATLAGTGRQPREASSTPPTGLPRQRRRNRVPDRPLATASTS